MLAVLHFDYPIYSHRARLMCLRRECTRGNSCNNSSYKLPNRPMYTHYKQEISTYHTPYTTTILLKPPISYLFSLVQPVSLISPIPTNPSLALVLEKQIARPGPQSTPVNKPAASPSPAQFVKTVTGRPSPSKPHPSIPVSITPRKLTADHERLLFI